MVICGRNAKLTESLRMRKWPLKLHVKVRCFSPTAHLHELNLLLSTQGFVNNMADYMVACDCIISKAGPGTIAEAMICGIPIVLNGMVEILLFIYISLHFLLQVVSHARKKAIYHTSLKTVSELIVRNRRRSLTLLRDGLTHRIQRSYKTCRCVHSV